MRTLELLTSETENEEILSSWQALFGLVAKEVKLKFIQGQVLDVIQELLKLNTPFPKRKLGNELVVDICLAHGNVAFREESRLLTFVLAMFQDVNWKIKEIGVKFFSRFLRHCQPDFLKVCYSELVDMTTDADILIRIEAIDALSTISD